MGLGAVMSPLGCMHAGHVVQDGINVMKQDWHYIESLLKTKSGRGLKRVLHISMTFYIFKSLKP
jgi:hypothetical protein